MMKAAMNDFLKGGPAAPAAKPSPSDSEMDSMFGGDPMDSGEGAEDPLMEALQTAGFPVDEGKLSQIRAILEAPAEGDDMNPADDVGGMEGGPEIGGGPSGIGGAVPSPMKGKPNL
jgi:hypothetical protein